MNIILRRRKLGRGSARGICEASTTGLVAVRHWRSRDWLGREGPSYVFRWGCTASLPELETNPVIINSARSIHWCSDKRVSRLAMQEAGVSVPTTYTTEELTNVGGGLTYVLRPSRHAQGRNLFSGTAAECRTHIASNPQYRGGYASLLINKVAEYRVFVCQNRVVWVAKKTPGNPDQVAWNVAQGGRFDNVRWGDWPKNVIIESLKAAKVSGCDFCGVDVMVDADGKAFVLEVNSAPSQTSPYRQSCVAKVFDYIVNNGKDAFDDVPDSPRRTWKSYIHPALRSNDEPLSSSS